jgi:hypothetical protein
VCAGDDAERDIFYGLPPGDAEALALDQMRRVYGIGSIAFDEQRHAIEVEYDASRLTESDVAALLAEAGFDVRQMMRGAR